MLLEIGIAEASGMSAVALGALGLVGIIFREHLRMVREQATEHRAERKEMMGTLQQSTEASKAMIALVKELVK